MKIISDGTSNNTHVYDDCGNDLSKYIVAIQWELNAGSVALATITFIIKEVELEVPLYNTSFRYRRVISDE